jgi:hypothetical protein
MSRRQKIVVCAVLAALAVLYTGAVATGGRTGTGDAGATGNGFVRWLGRLAGEPTAVVAADLSADCLADTTITVRGSCPLHVAASRQDLRQLRLHARDAVTVTARAPRGDSLVRDDVAAGTDVDITVDGRGGDVTLACADTTTCVLTLS